MNIKAKLETKHQVLSCYDFELAMKAIDFEAIEIVEKVEEFGIYSFGEPALSINNGVATIKVRGLLAPNVGVDASSWGLTGYDVIEHYVKYANNSGNVERIILDIDSGGGYVKGIHQCCEVIKASKKPIETLVSGDAYSGAYWLAVCGKKVTTYRHSGIGSIGCYVEHFDCSKMLENEGIVARLFKSSKWKGAFSSNRPLTEEEQQRLQADVDHTANEFFEHVAKNRNVSKKAVADLEGDTFTAEKALALGLIDSIETGEQTMQEKTKTGQTQKAATVSEAEMRAEMEAKIRAEVKAEMEAKQERINEINALDAGQLAKNVLATDAFASVPIEAMVELVKAFGTYPKTFTQAMDEVGGANVGADPSNFVNKTEEEIQAKQQAEAEKILKEKKVRVI